MIFNNSRAAYTLYNENWTGKYYYKYLSKSHTFLVSTVTVDGGLLLGARTLEAVGCVSIAVLPTESKSISPEFIVGSISLVATEWLEILYEPELRLKHKPSIESIDSERFGPVVGLFNWTVVCSVICDVVIEVDEDVDSVTVNCFIDAVSVVRGNLAPGTGQKIQILMNLHFNWIHLMSDYNVNQADGARWLETHTSSHICTSDLSKLS